MKIILTESQLKTVINERPIRYTEGEEYGISEQIDWLNMQKEFMFIHGEAGQKVRLVNNIIHNHIIIDYVINCIYIKPIIINTKSIYIIFM